MATWVSSSTTARISIPQSSIQPSSYDFTKQPQLIEYSELAKERLKHIGKMRQERSQLFAFIKSKLSRESEDELERYTLTQTVGGPKTYTQICDDRDPLLLWNAVRELHIITTASKNTAIVLLQATKDYRAVRMGEFETIQTFKERFDAKLLAYNTASGTVENPVQTAMHFLDKLCRIRYNEYYHHRINLIHLGSSRVLSSINEINVEAITWVVNKPPARMQRAKASFATKNKRSPTDQDIKSNDRSEDKPEKNKTYSTAERNSMSTGKKQDTSNHNSTGAKERDISLTVCWNCNRDCRGLNAMTCTKNAHSGLLPEKFEIALDSCSQVNIIHRRFLKNIRPGSGRFVGLSKQDSNVTEVGDLEGFLNASSVMIVKHLFYPCLMSKSYILSRTYRVRLSSFIRMTRDITFRQRNKLCVADFTPLDGSRV